MLVLDHHFPCSSSKPQCSGFIPSPLFPDQIILDARLAHDTIIGLLEEQVGDQEAQQTQQCNNLDWHAASWWS